MKDDRTCRRDHQLDEDSRKIGNCGRAGGANLIGDGRTVKNSGQQPDGNRLSTAKRLSPPSKQNQSADNAECREPADQSTRVCELTGQRLAGEQPGVEQHQSSARSG